MVLRIIAILGVFSAIAAAQAAAPAERLVHYADVVLSADSRPVRGAPAP